MNKIVQKRIDSGRCTQCGKVNDRRYDIRSRTMGTTYRTCSECSDKLRKKKAERTKNGLCRDCGKRPASSHHSPYNGYRYLCDECFKKTRERNTCDYANEYYRRTVAKGLCPKCLSEKHGEHTVLCSECARQANELAKRAYTDMKHLLGYAPGYSCSISINRFNKLKAGEKFFREEKSIKPFSKKYRLSVEKNPEIVSIDKKNYHINILIGKTIYKLMFNGLYNNPNRLGLTHWEKI